MTSPIHTTRRGPVLEVTIDRPKANAIDAATSRIMGDVFAAFRDDPDLRVAILTGTGEKFFCPGWDLKAAAQGEAPDSDYGVGGFGGTTRFHSNFACLKLKSRASGRLVIAVGEPPGR